MSASKIAIIDYLVKHPGSTSRQIADGLGFKVSRVATTMTELHNQKRVTRKENRSLTNSPIYMYSLSEVYSVPQRKKKQNHGGLQQNHGGLQQKNEDFSFDDALNGIALALARLIVNQVKAKVAVELTNIVPESLPAPSTVEVKPTVAEVRARGEQKVLSAPKLPKILVTGLLPQQAGMIQNEFCDCFDIHFWNDRNGDGTESLRAACSNCDVVFWHVRHSNHGSENIVKNSNAKLVRVPGGMTQMREALTEHYASC